jgi:amino-acid N-acetyltransferase
MRFQVGPARAHDLAPALELLRCCDLPTEGVAEAFGHFVAVRDDAELVGLAGLEVCGSAAMLRSVAVHPDNRGEGAGQELVAAAEDLGRHLGLGALYLLTTTARGFFARLGYEDCARDAAPPAIQDSWEFRAGCPHTAALLRKRL